MNRNMKAGRGVRLVQISLYIKLYLGKRPPFRESAGYHLKSKMSWMDSLKQKKTKRRSKTQAEKRKQTMFSQRSESFSLPSVESSAWRPRFPRLLELQKVSLEVQRFTSMVSNNTQSRS